MEHLLGSGNMAKGKTDQIPVLMDLIPLDGLRDHQKINKYVDMDAMPDSKKLYEKINKAGEGKKEGLPC